MIITVSCIIKSYRNFLGTLYFKLHMLCTALLYQPIYWHWSRTLYISNSSIFHLSYIYFQIFLYKNNRFLHFHMFLKALLLIPTFFFFLKSIISIACFLKDSQNLFMKTLPLYTSCLFSMLLNDDIVDIEKPDGICSLTFVVNEFLWIFFLFLMEN